MWAVRASEILIRDFALAPYFIDAGEPWARAMKKAAKVLGDSNWSKAFAKIEEWYGPFDEPLTDDDRNAWDVWTGIVVRRRGELVHGKTLEDATDAEARDVIAFANRMASWFSQRFLTSETHPG